MIITSDFSKIISTPELKDSVREKISEGEEVLSFSYTDYGGDFFDKVGIEYFIKHYPDNIVWEHTIYSGKNGIIFGDVVKEFKEEYESYPLGFDDIESFFYEMTNEVEHEDFTRFIEDIKSEYVVSDECMNWLIDNKSGYYSITTQGLDFCYSDLIKELESEGLVTKIED